MVFLSAAWAVQALGLLLQWLAALPLATLSMPAPPLWAAAVGLAGGLLLALRGPWSVRLLGLPLLLPVLLWQPPRPLPGEFDLLAADIGQGNAVLVRTAHHSLLYDDLTPLENLEFTARLYGIASPRDAARRSIESVGLSDRGNDPAGR